MKTLGQASKLGIEKDAVAHGGQVLIAFVFRGTAFPPLCGRDVPVSVDRQNEL